MKNFRHISKAVYTDITNTLTIVSLFAAIVILYLLNIPSVILSKI